MGKFNPYDRNNMYRMDEEPPKMKLNDYIAEYKRTGDGYWLACYLHRFEQDMLNGWVYRQCQRYGQQSRFKDIKQEMIEAMLEKSDDYNPTVGTTLIQFAGSRMVNAVHTYLRKNAGIFLLSDKYYQNLRKVSAIYYRDKELAIDARIQAVISETGFSLKRVLGYIDHGKWFRYPESIESNISDFVQAKLTPDEFASPEYVVLHKLFTEVYLAQVDDLRERDKRLLFDYLGIVDFNRGWVIDKNKIRLADIADKHQLRDEQSVTNRFRKIVAALRAELEKQGWIGDAPTQEPTEPSEKDMPELTDLDHQIIDYAVRKWKESGKAAEFYMLFRDGKYVDERLILEFLKIWLY